MALHVPAPPGFSSMLKEGTRHFSGIEEAVFRNIEACVELGATVRTAYGPNGLNKMIINHLEKLFVTNDAATMMKELEVQHPAAKLLVMASQHQEQECGDGTNYVLMFAAALLERARQLLTMGLSVSEVINGYELATKKALDQLQTLVIGSVSDLRDKEAVRRVIRAAVMSKQLGREEMLADLITDACLRCLKGKETAYSFNVDNIRVCKILGSGVDSSRAIPGMVFQRQVESDVHGASKCKVAIFSCPFDTALTETKGTVLLKSAEELLSYSKGEEKQMEQMVEAIAKAVGPGGVIVSGGKVGDLALHYANRLGLLVVRLNSKFDLRRLCITLGATALPRLDPPTAEEMGYCDSVRVEEFGDTSVVIFQQDSVDSAVNTILVRGATDNLMDDVERAIDDGVNNFKVLTKDARLLAGAGASEIELSRLLSAHAATCPGLEQYSIKHFAEALETIPKALAENAGAKATHTLANLHAEHQAGKKTVGVLVEGEEMVLADASGDPKNGIVDLYLTKYSAIKLAASAAITVLRVDQIIMARQAGGPKPRENRPGLDHDDE